jgi:hypothetical protein
LMAAPEFVPLVTLTSTWRKSTSSIFIRADRTAPPWRASSPQQGSARCLCGYLWPAKARWLGSYLWGVPPGFHEFGEAVLGKLKAKHDPPIISPIIHHLRVNELSWEEETRSHGRFDSNATNHFSTELCL